MDIASLSTHAPLRGSVGRMGIEGSDRKMMLLVPELHSSHSSHAHPKPHTHPQTPSTLWAVLPIWELARGDILGEVVAEPELPKLPASKRMAWQHQQRRCSRRLQRLSVVRTRGVEVPSRGDAWHRVMGRWRLHSTVEVQAQIPGLEALDLIWAPRKRNICSLHLLVGQHGVVELPREVLHAHAGCPRIITRRPTTTHYLS